METTYYRSDLVKNFPVRFQFKELVKHFATEHECVVGRSPNKQVIFTIAKTFLFLYKRVRTKLDIF